MSGKSKEEIAFELVSKLKGVGVWGENNMSAILDMYAECLEATSGARDIPGRQPVAPAEPVLQVQQPAAPAAAQPVVHQQQQRVEQAFQTQVQR